MLICTILNDAFKIIFRLTIKIDQLINARVACIENKVGLYSKWLVQIF